MPEIFAHLLVLWILRTIHPMRNGRQLGKNNMQDFRFFEGNEGDAQAHSTLKFGIALNNLNNGRKPNEHNGARGSVKNVP